MALLAVNNIYKKEKENVVVNSISFAQEPLQKTAIAGVTGSGKTTLLKMIAGFIQPDAGEILFENKRVLGPYEQLIPGHPKIAYLSQHFELLNNYWVREVLEMSNKLSDKKAQNIYALCKIEHLMQRRTNQLSGGEKQRIALAMQLTKAPELLLLDEPFSNLDMVHKSIIKNVIEDVYTKLQLSCIIVSHDAADMLSWADRMLIMQDGAIVQEGTPKQVYHQPINEYCASLLGAYNLVDTSILPFIKSEATNKKKLLIRPEQFIVETNAEKGFKVIVESVLFWGSYYTLTVKIQQQQLIVKTNIENFAVGDTIYLGVTKDSLWYI